MFAIHQKGSIYSDYHIFHMFDTDQKPPTYSDDHTTYSTCFIKIKYPTYSVDFIFHTFAIDQKGPTYIGDYITYFTCLLLIKKGPSYSDYIKYFT